MQRLHKYIVVFLSICLLVSLVGCTGTSTSGTKTPDDSKEKVDKVKIKLSTSWGENSSVQESALKFGQLLSESSNGRFEVTVYPSNQLASGNQQTAVEMLQNGDIEVAMFGMTVLSFLDDRLAVVNMPFSFSSYEDVDKVLFNGEGRQALNTVLEENGMIALDYGEAGFRQITNSKRIVRTPEDMRGLKFRILATCPMFFDLYNALGANPTAMNMSEVFSALQQGVVDGQENAVDTAKSWKINEVQDYITLWNGVYDAIPLVASPKLMDNLSEEDKALFYDCARQAMEFQRKINRENEATILEEFSKSITVTTLTEEETEAFKKAVKPVYDSWYNKIGADIMKAFGQ